MVINFLLLFNGKELDYETGLYYYGARYYDPKVSLWLNTDPMMLRDEAIDNENITNGGIFNPQNNAVYSFSYQNPIRYVDPDGECPNCITAAGGAVIGGVIGGLLEGGMQLYRNGKITNWNAVGGSVLQGAITGGAAGFTGGASLAVTAGVSAGANVVGGTANRAIQGKKTTAKDIAVDATVGAIAGMAGKYISRIFTSRAINNAKSIGITDEFIQSATSPSGKQNLTNVGRALQKHAGREGSNFENIKFSHKTANEDGLSALNEIINTPKNNLIIQEAKQGGKEIYNKTTGRGFAISRNGNFNGFRELKTE